MTSSSTVTGRATSPSPAMNSTDDAQPARSIAPNGTPADGLLHVAIVASRIASWVAGSAASSGTTAVAASRPTAGSAAISSIARSVAATNARSASPFVAIVSTEATRPGPGSAVSAGTRRTTTSSPAS